MGKTKKTNLVVTSIALYFTYFIHGFGASIMGQTSRNFPEHGDLKSAVL